MRVHLRIRQLGMLARLSGHWPATSELLSGLPSIFRSQPVCSGALIAEFSLMRSFISVSCSFVCRRQYCRFSVVFSAEMCSIYSFSKTLSRRCSLSTLPSRSRSRFPLASSIRSRVCLSAVLAPSHSWALPSYRFRYFLIDSIMH